MDTRGLVRTWGTVSGKGECWKLAGRLPLRRADEPDSRSSVPRLESIVVRLCRRPTRMAAVPSIVTTDWLGAHLEDPNVQILDASWFLPGWGRNAAEEFRAKRIPGSKFFDVDGVANLESGLPHMMPSARSFAAAADALGVRSDSTVVLYDRVGTFSSPRAWWMFRVFGHDKVAILAGGFPEWERQGLAVETDWLPDDVVHVATAAAQSPSTSPAYPAELRSGAVYDMQQVRQTLSSGSAQVLDARAAGRFNGTEPEPRPEIPSGHMPGALNVPFMSLLDGNAPSGAYKGKTELEQAFKVAGVDLTKPIVCSCASGITAAVLVHALDQLGVKDVALYDASWIEWAQTPENKIVTGAVE